MAAKLPCHIRIVEARDLKAADVQGTSDPLVVLSLKGLLKKKHRTASIQNTVNPIWNEEFVLEPHHPEKDILVIKVFDKDVGKNDLLGMVRLPIFPYFNRGSIDEWRPLVTRTGQPARGDIHIQIQWGTGPIAHALSDSHSMLSNRQAYGESAALDRNHDGRVDANDMIGQPGYAQQGLVGQPGYAHQGLGQPGVVGGVHQNPLDRNHDGRVDMKDLTGQPGYAQQGLVGQPGYAHQGLGQPGVVGGAHHNPLDRNHDGRVDANDLTGRPTTGFTQPITTVGTTGAKGTPFPSGASVGQAQGYTTTTTTITHH